MFIKNRQPASCCYSSC